MKLFDGGRAPNPRRVRIFLAEKGIAVPLVPVDMGAIGHRGEEVASRNPLQPPAGARTRRRHGALPSRSRSAAISRRCIPNPRCSAAARSARRRSRCGSGAWSSTCSLPVSQRLPPHPSGDEGMGGAAGSRMGRGQQAEGAGVPGMLDAELAAARIRRRRRLLDRRHHRPGRDRLHEAGAHRGAGGADQRRCAGIARWPPGRAPPPDDAPKAGRI